MVKHRIFPKEKERKKKAPSWKPGVNPVFFALKKRLFVGKFYFLTSHKVVFRNTKGRIIPLAKQNDLFFFVGIEEIPKSEVFKLNAIYKEHIGYFLMTKENADATFKLFDFGSGKI